MKFEYGIKIYEPGQENILLPGFFVLPYFFVLRVTYIYIDMPVIGNFFRIPVYGKSNRVFCFGEKCSSKMENVNDAS